MKLRIGTRGSRLALWQAEFIQSEINSISPETETEVVIVKTEGDKLKDSPLSEIGGKGVFVKELENALLSSNIDIAVHSLKDMPSVLPPGLMIGAVSKRQHPADALVSRNNIILEDLKPGARVGTGSLRRKAQLLYHFPELEIVPIRGNVDTRVGKIESEGLDAVVLAAAGLQRMGLADKICQVLDTDKIIPAPGQGIIAVESKINDNETNKILSKLSNLEALTNSLLERSFLRALGGDCNIPAGCYSKYEGEELVSIAFISDEWGKQMYIERRSGSKSIPEEIGVSLFNDIIENGAGELVKGIN